jgi:hypothetical protein
MEKIVFSVPVRTGLSAKTGCRCGSEGEECEALIGFINRLCREDRSTKTLYKISPILKYGN